MDMFSHDVLAHQDRWEDSSAGGSLGKPTYFTNPQYRMVLTQPKTRLHIQLEAPKNVSVLSYPRYMARDAMLHDMGYYVIAITFQSCCLVVETPCIVVPNARVVQKHSRVV